MLHTRASVTVIVILNKNRCCCNYSCFARQCQFEDFFQKVILFTKRNVLITGRTLKF